MKKIFKKAFTIIEMLVVFTIIGIILVVELHTLNSKTNQYGAVYYSVYNSLSKAAYNIVADLSCPDKGIETLLYPCPTDGTTRPFPTDSYHMCLRMAELYNIAGKHNCSSNDSKYITVNSSNSSDIINKLKDDNNVIFRTSNSAKFYLSKPLRITDSLGHTVDYFIVFVDLNGDKAPNFIKHNGSERKPDIVPFALTSEGSAIPMGYPIYDADYLTAKVQFSVDFLTPNAKPEVTQSMEFYSAVYGAWGSSRNTGGSIVPRADIAYTLDFNSNFPDDLEKISLNGADFPSADDLTRFRNIVDSKYDTSRCDPNSFTCWAVIDKNSTTRF